MASQFQFTPLCERLRPAAAGKWIKPVNFNSRLSARGYRHSIYNDLQLSLFQFTPLCERLHFAPVDIIFGQYFNSRLSARGYKKSKQDPDNHTISIHASLREATQFCDTFPPAHRISIHASLREATAKTDNI